MYYAVHGGRIVFGSEPKAVLALGDIPAQLDEESLQRYLTFLWVPDPDTLFEGVSKLPPGHRAVFERSALSVERYWDPRFEPDARPAEEHVDKLRAALNDAVARQLVSDVPLGTFLSGGLDSTLVTTLASRAAGRPLLAIAAGFEGPAWLNEPGQDDLPFARVVAKREPSLDYRELVVEGASADVAGELAQSMDDPVADPAAITTFLICRAAKEQATVMLSGTGAEELFGGYPRHRVVGAAARAARLPRGARATVARVGRTIPGARAGRGMGLMRHTRKFLTAMGDDEPYIAFCAHHDAGSLSALLGSPVDWEGVTSVHRAHLGAANGLSPLSKALYLDLKTYLPCLNLAYTDRASMAASVEVRVPILDELVVDTALRLPDELKVSRGQGKVALRRAAEGIVPKTVMTRAKTGFGAPVRTWMKEFSSETIRDCLSPQSIRNRGLVSAAAVAAMRRDLERGRSDQALQLWAIVTLELWARRFLDRSPSYVA
jgi:asparagine synthase (glutamine-hydrolysing)